MTDDILKDVEVKPQVCHVNSKTKPLFKEMLNQVGSEISVGQNKIKYGDAICRIDEEQFISLFNRWITECCKKKIMIKTLSNDSTKNLEWNQEYSEVERTLRSMNVLKEML